MSALSGEGSELCSEDRPAGTGMNERQFRLTTFCYDPNATGRTLTSQDFMIYHS